MVSNLMSELGFPQDVAIHSFFALKVVLLQLFHTARAMSEQELTVDRFIPNDTYIADGSRVVLITGANCSGKSVYLKQVQTNQ